jgi:hypothetical protein
MLPPITRTPIRRVRSQHLWKIRNWEIEATIGDNWKRAAAKVFGVAMKIMDARMTVKTSDEIFWIP